MYFEIMWLHIPPRYFYQLQVGNEKGAGFLPFTGVKILNISNKSGGSEDAFIRN